MAQVLDNPFWTNSGFAPSLPACTLAPGPHTLTVYAHTGGKGWWFNQVTFTVGEYRPRRPLHGRAARVWRHNHCSASWGEDSPEAAAAFGSSFEMAGYQLDFKPVHFSVGSHHIYAYAVSSRAGLETVAVTGFDISR